MTGKDHNSSSLAYLLARTKHKDKTGILFMDERTKFPYEKYRADIQKEMRDRWKIKIIPETDAYKKYYFELYLAIKLKTKWNSFETH